MTPPKSLQPLIAAGRLAIDADGVTMWHRHGARSALFRAALSLAAIILLTEAALFGWSHQVGLDGQTLAFRVGLYGIATLALGAVFSPRVTRLEFGREFSVERRMLFGLICVRLRNWPLTGKPQLTVSPYEGPWPPHWSEARQSRIVLQRYDAHVMEITLTWGDDQAMRELVRWLSVADPRLGVRVERGR